jgi:hypothetical protein
MPFIIIKGRFSERDKTPRLFGSWGEYDDGGEIDDLELQPELAELPEVVKWLTAMSAKSRDFVLRSAVIDNEQMTAIKAKLK